MSFTLPNVPMTIHTLNAVKGWPRPHALDYHTEIDPGEPQPVNSGTVVSLNGSGNFVRGVGNNDVMPLFLFPNSNANDIVNPGGNPADDVGSWVAINSPGQCVALVAVGAYELVSTEIIEADIGDFVPNAWLTSPYSGAGNAGLIGLGIKGTNTLIGVVSGGVVDSGYGQTAVQFWSGYWPHSL